MLYMYILHASLQLLMQIVLQVTNEWMSASSQLANDESSLTQCIGLLQWPQNILTVTVVTVLKCNTCSISLWQSLYMNICSTWQVVAVYDDDIHFMWLSVSLIMANISRWRGNVRLNNDSNSRRRTLNASRVNLNHVDVRGGQSARDD